MGQGPSAVHFGAMKGPSAGEIVMVSATQNGRVGLTGTTSCQTIAPFDGPQTRTRSLGCAASRLMTTVVGPEEDFPAVGSPRRGSRRGGALGNDACRLA